MRGRGVGVGKILGAGAGAVRDSVINALHTYKPTNMQLCTYVGVHMPRKRYSGICHHTTL